MYYTNSHFIGMHFIWWVFWLCIVIWIFFTPYAIPGQQHKKDSPLDILKKRFVSGQIDKEEYLEKKAILEAG